MWSRLRTSTGLLTAVSLLIVALAICGCQSPEDGRIRGGGPGGDGGNYRQKPVHAPSKIDRTKLVPNPFLGDKPHVVIRQDMHAWWP
jgi:hypothetical protein